MEFAEKVPSHLDGINAAGIDRILVAFKKFSIFTEIVDGRKFSTTFRVATIDPIPKAMVKIRTKRKKTGLSVHPIFELPS